MKILLQFNHIGHVRFSYNPSFSVCFFSRNSVFLSQQFSWNRVFQPVSAKVQTSERGRTEYIYIYKIIALTLRPCWRGTIPGYYKFGNELCGLKLFPYNRMRPMRKGKSRRQEFDPGTDKKAVKEYGNTII